MLVRRVHTYSSKIRLPILNTINYLLILAGIPLAVATCLDTKESNRKWRIYEKLFQQAVTYADTNKDGQLDVEEATDLFRRAGWYDQLRFSTQPADDFKLQHRLSLGDLEKAIKSYETEQKK